MTVKENGDGGWSFNDVMRKNRDTVEWWGEWPVLK
jgi:hypothetical protein